ncbi:MAG: tetratricopeptide repeat protein, partial [Nitrospirae bacterium]|nr:tetratricopeptide repeat protein [Nitrospirota bacterium]
MRKNQYLILLSVTILLFYFNPVSAEVKTFEKEYTYQASDFDSKNSSRTIALETVKRLLLGELGTYLISETEVKNMQFSKDQLTSYSAGIVSAEILDEKWDGKSYWLKAKVSADPQKVEEELKKLIEDKDKLKELEDTKKRADELTKENIKLRKDLEASAKTVDRDTSEEAKNLKTYNETITGLSAINWFENGYKDSIANKWEDVIYEYNKSIELNPQLVGAYYNRGVSYSKLGN